MTCFVQTRSIGAPYFALEGVAVEDPPDVHWLSINLKKARRGLPGDIMWIFEKTCSGGINVAVFSHIMEFHIYCQRIQFF